MRRAKFGLAGLFGCIVILALSTITAHAQFRAAIQGVVTDSAGGTVPGAAVVLTNKETGVSQQATTSGEGF